MPTLQRVRGYWRYSTASTSFSTTCGRSRRTSCLALATLQSFSWKPWRKSHNYRADSRPRLSKPAISLYRHHLTSDLEGAIRGSNAQFDSPDVLRRLDARVLEYSHGELGWDCFALEYKVEAPLNAVLDARSMAAYDRLFQHLWHLKRVETALTQGWMRVTSASRSFESLPSLHNDWHHCRIIQAEMVHFLRQLQAFCQLEVIECSWQALLDFTDRRDGDLDSLIAAHRTYLDRVVRKILLAGARGRDDTLLNLVREALAHILSFRNATEDLYGWSLGEATRLDRTRDAERVSTIVKLADDRVSVQTIRLLRRTLLHQRPSSMPSANAFTRVLPGSRIQSSPCARKQAATRTSTCDSLPSASRSTDITISEEARQRRRSRVSSNAIMIL